MKTVLVSSLAVAAAMTLAPAAEKAKSQSSKAPPKTPERTYSDTMWDMCTMPPKIGEKTAAPRTAAEKATVGVSLTDRAIQMPRSLGPGRTAFVVTNRGKEKQNFQISGEGVDKKFMMSLAPNQTKTMEVDLKSGSYRISNPVKEAEGQGAMMTTLKVK